MATWGHLVHYESSERLRQLDALKAACELISAMRLPPDANHLETRIAALRMKAIAAEALNDTELPLS